MPAVQTNTSDLTDELNDLRGSDLDSFTITRLKRDIFKICDYDERYMLLGMLHAVLGNIEDTIENFNKSIRLNKDHITCDNFILALGNLNNYELAKDKAIEYSKGSNSPTLLKVSLHYSNLFLDLENQIDSLESLKKLKKISAEQEYIHTMEVSIMRQVLDTKLISQDDLKRIGCIAMNAIASHEVDVIDNSVSLACEDKTKLRVKYYIDPSVETETILSINESLIDNLIDEDLDLLPVVVSFIRNPNKVLAGEQNELLEVV